MQKFLSLPRALFFFGLPLYSVAPSSGLGLGAQRHPRPPPRRPAHSRDPHLAIHRHGWRRRGRPIPPSTRRGHRRGRQRADRRRRPYPPEHLASQERGGHGSVIAAVNGRGRVIAYHPHMTEGDSQDLGGGPRPFHRHRIPRLCEPRRGGRRQRTGVGRGAAGRAGGATSKASGGGAFVQRAEGGRAARSVQRARHQWVASRETQVAECKHTPHRPMPAHTTAAHASTKKKAPCRSRGVQAHTSPPMRLMMDTRRSVGLLSVTTSPTAKTAFALARSPLRYAARQR